jgi:hypothetical protein
MEPMTTLQRLESDSPHVAGILFTFPSGTSKQITWEAEQPITPTLDAAKRYAAVMLDAIMKEGRVDDAERTNWASCTAAIQKLIQEFNDALIADAGFRRAAAPTLEH